MRKNRFQAAAALAALTVAVLPAQAQDPERAEDWLRECRDHESRYERHCEIREYTLPAGRFRPLQNS